MKSYEVTFRVKFTRSQVVEASDEDEAAAIVADGLKHELQVEDAALDLYECSEARAQEFRE